MRYTEMKNTGIQFVGDIPKHWEYRDLKTIASCNDEVLPENTAPDYSFDYIDIGSVHANKSILGCEHIKFKDAPSRARRIVRKNDVIVSTVRTYLKAIAWIGYYEIPHIASTGFAVIRAKTVDSVFLYYALLSDNFVSQVEANSVGISYPAINANQLMSLKIPVPPIEEQEAIAAYLDEKCATIDEIIGQAKATIEEYKAWKASVIFEAVTKGLDPNAEMKDSGVEWMGEIPKHWSCIPMKFMLNERNQKNDPVVTSERLSLSIDIGVTLYAEKTTNLDRFKEDVSQYKVAHAGDLVLNSMNMIVGAVGIAPVLGCVSPAYYVFYDNDNNYTVTRYCDYIFKNKRLRGCLFSLGQGIMAIDRGDGRINTCRLKVSRDDLGRIMLPCPPIEEQCRIISFLDKQCAAIDGIITEKQSLIDDLGTYKKSLIYETVTGKRRVC